jgi:hypothetical protein
MSIMIERNKCGPRQRLLCTSLGQPRTIVKTLVDGEEEQDFVIYFRTSSSMQFGWMGGFT